MPGTTMPAARKRLIELCQAHPSAPPDGVTYEEPPPERAGPECIYVGAVQTAEVEDIALKANRRRRREVYEMQVVCKALVAGGSQYDADVRAAVMLQVVDETVADYPTLSGADLVTDQQIESCLVTGWETDEGGAVEGSWRGFLVTVRVTARLL